MSNAPLMMKLGLMTPLMLAAMLLASGANAAEPSAADTRERGTLSREATAAGPAVNTSAMSPSSAAEADPAAPPPPAEEGALAESQSSSRRANASGPQAVVRNDRLNLDTTVVTGNRELPKVLYIVPWKRSDLGTLPAQPFNTLLDEALTPLDRDVFRREVTYYDAAIGGANATQSTSDTSR